MNFFFFGDSICFGQYVSPHFGWVTRISSDIAREFPEKDITVMNPSISGNTTRMALERMAFDVYNHGIDFILIQFGINDSHFWATDKGYPRISKAGF